MKVQLICETCGTVLELKPTTDGQHARVPNYLRGSNFYINSSGIIIEKDGEMDDDNEVIVNAVLQEIRIDCKCGKYMVLTGFEDFQ